ncbi:MULTISPECIES: hypothetical protein [Actinosynnema]|uniref:hypothetical protein n=1 Tax=Actinosynnema TaxID=40566 RepID=UPI0020A238F5|nr:hypothetical protein [Actinosynnema pretiosum]
MERAVGIGSALVLGGTGMLKGCSDELVEQGWQVVLPSRRARLTPGQAVREAVRRRGHVPTPRTAAVGAGAGTGGSVVQVAADWSRPQELAGLVNDALLRPAGLLVAWVHDSYRVPVLNAVAPLLDAGAPVVEVHDISAVSPTGGLPEPVLPGHPTQQVVLGFVRRDGRTRWLSHEQTASGVMEAVHRALAGDPPSVRQVGEVDTWEVRY